MNRRLQLPISAALLLLLAFTGRAQGPSVQAGATARPPVLTPAAQAGATAAAAPAPMPMLFTSEARVSSKVDRLIITVGEIINYQMEVEFPKGYAVAIPPPGAQLGEFLIRNYEFPQAEIKGDRMVQKFNFKITAYSTGEALIPRLPVIINKDKQAVRVILTEEIKISVAPVSSAEDMEIKDVKPPLEAPFNYKPLLIAGLVILGLAVIAVSVMVIVRRMRRPQLEMPEPLPEPEVLAMKELSDLEAQGLLEKGEVDLYYTRLSEILRRYLGLRFSIYALEFTTSEIMAALKTSMLEHATFQMVQQFLEECDLVKFARFSPEPKAQREVLPKGKKIIELTRPAPAPEPAQPKSAAGAG
jgi:hypothetical protein